MFLVAGFAVKYGLQTITWVEGESGGLPIILGSRMFPQALPQPAAAAPPMAMMAVTAASAKSGKSGKPAQPPPPPQVRAYNYEFKSPGRAIPQPKGALTYTEFRYATGQESWFSIPIRKWTPCAR